VCETDLLFVPAVDGHCEVLRVLPASKPTSLRRILVLPGNPGLAQYYRSFARYVCENLQAEVHVVGWVGHVQASVRKTVTGRKRRLHGIDDQVASAQEYFSRWSLEGEQQGREGIFLIGHSIGAHVAFKILAERGEHVAGVVALFPFLQYNFNSFTLAWQNAALRIPLAQPAVATLGTVLCSLPIPLRRAIMRNGIKDMDEEYALLTLNSLLPRRMLRQWFWMGMTEFDALKCEPPYTLYERNRDRVQFVYTADDCWAPLEIRDQLADRGLGVHTIEARHQFCTTEAGSSTLAAKVASLYDAIRSESSAIQQVV